MALLDDLQELGQTLSPHELPSNAQAVLGALVKVLEDSGTTVPEDLHPPDPADLERARLEARLADLGPAKDKPPAKDEKDEGKKAPAGHGGKS